MRLKPIWRSRIALGLAASLASTATLPLIGTTAAVASPDRSLVAQQFPDSWRNTLPAGTQIPVEYDDAEKIVLTPEESVDVTLLVARDIRNSSGRVVIPEGSEIDGRLEPAGDGTQFVAETLRLADDDEEEVDIDAESNIVNDRETITRDGGSDILQGAAIGGVAGAVLAEILGDIDVVEVLAGAGIGALASVLLRGRRDVEVIVVYPEELDVRLQSDLVIER